MMELLAGPNTVGRIGGLYTGPYSVGQAFWDDELGIGSIAAITTIMDPFGWGANYFIVQLDGTCGVRASTPHGSVLVDLSGEYEWALYNFGSDGVAYLYGLDKKSGVCANNIIKIGTGIFAQSDALPQIRTDDRLIAIHGRTITKRALDGSDPDWVPECTLAPGFQDLIFSYPNAPTVSRTKDVGIVCLIYPSGGILFYDVIGKRQVIKPWIPYIGPNVGAWYSVKFDIYISYTISYTVDGGEWYVSTWANVVRPATLSNPAPVTSIAAGKVSQIRVRLLGSKGEPCEDELVSWSISSGDGALTATQSTTDANGYAYIGYVAPIAGGSAPTFQAVVEF